jgi:hypothetical protein
VLLLLPLPSLILQQVNTAPARYLLRRAKQADG